VTPLAVGENSQQAYSTELMPQLDNMNVYMIIWFKLRLSSIIEGA
jgi:hypothetical protein